MCVQIAAPATTTATAAAMALGELEEVLLPWLKAVESMEPDQDRNVELEKGGGLQVEVGPARGARVALGRELGGSGCVSWARGGSEVGRKW